jgi:hypothetical protein
VLHTKKLAKGKWLRCLFKTTIVHRVHNVDLDARINSVNWPLLGLWCAKWPPHPFCLVMKIGFNSVEPGTLNTAGNGLQKVLG